MRTRMPATRAFSMLEVMFAVAILTVAIFGVLAAVGANAQLRETTRASDAAAKFLRDRMELYRSTEIDDVVALAQSETSWTGVPAANTRADGAYAGLPPTAQYRVVLLSEAEASAAFGHASTPLDLDHDETPGEDGTESDPAAYRIVPLRFAIRWPKGASGGWSTLETSTFIYPTVYTD